jgi:hypothetical protein
VNQRPQQNQAPQQNQEGFRSFGQPNRGNENNNALVKPTLRPQPRVYEQQGTPQEENRGESNAHNEQPTSNRPAENREFHPPQPQETHPLVRPAPPVQQRTPQQEQQQAQKFNQWHEQRPVTPPPTRQQPSHASEPKPSKR